MLMGIHHVAIKTRPSDFDRVVSFYTDILGMKRVRGWGAGDSRCIMISTGGESVLEIMSTADGDVPAFGLYRHVAYRADDVDGITEKVRAAGYQIEQEPGDVTIDCGEPYRLRVAFCRGPLGEQIEFFNEKD